jgi:hypothetical protein
LSETQNMLINIPTDHPFCSSGVYERLLQNLEFIIKNIYLLETLQEIYNPG